MVARTLDMAGCRTATTGTGAIALGARLEWADTQFLTFAEHPDIADGQVYALHIQEGRGWERVPAIYSASANTLTRSGASLTMQADGSVSTTPLSLSGDATVTAVLRGADQASQAVLQDQVAAAQASAAAAAIDAAAAEAAALAAEAAAALADPSGRILRAGDAMGGALALKAATLASHATTAAIWTGGNLFNFTGAATITDFPDAPQAGATAVLICAAGITFTNNANIAVQGGANYVTAANDVVTVYADTLSTCRVTIQKASGLAVIAAPVGWISIASGSFGAGTSLVLTSIPQTYSELLLVAKGVSHNSGGSAALTLDVSVNNGSAYSATAAAITATFAGASSRDFLMLFSRYAADTGAVTCVSATPPTSPDVAAAVVTGVNTAHTGGCNAFKIAAGGANFDAGTYVLYGRP